MREQSEQMKKRLIDLHVFGPRVTRVSILLLIIISLSITILFILAGKVVAFGTNQLTGTSNQVAYSRIVPSPSPTISISTSSSTSEADQVTSLAEFVIYWCGIGLAVVTALLAIAGTIGVIELRRIHQVRTDLTELRSQFTSHIEDVSNLKKQVGEELVELSKRFESESQTFMDANYTFTEANNAYKVGNNIGAIEYFLRVLEMQPKNIRVMERLGRAYSNLNETSKAIFYLEKALSIDPENVPALRSLGLCYRYIDKDKAIGYLKRALEIDPREHETWDFLGLFYRDQGDIDEAIFAHEQSLTLKRRPETEFYLSILYLKKGDKRRGKLMALNAENDLREHEHNERIRPVWKILIRAGANIIEGNEDEAFQLIQTLLPYITSQRTYDAVAGHLKFFLDATGNQDLIPKFTDILKVKEKEDAQA